MQALRTIKDESGNVTLDGLHQLAEEPSEKDLDTISKIPFNAAEMKESWGVESFDRDLSDEEALREMLLGPTANIAGMCPATPARAPRPSSPPRLSSRWTSGSSPARARRLCWR